MLGSVKWFLDNYSLRDPMLEGFIHGLATDLGVATADLSGNVRELRRVLTAFSEHPTGPKVELRRWLTWTCTAAFMRVYIL